MSVSFHGQTVQVENERQITTLWLRWLIRWTA
jgi:hypothetical protein